jgi:hypothetical protein
MKLRRILTGSVLAAALVAGAVPALAQTAAPPIAEKFVKPDQTMEYHFTLKAPAFTEKDVEQTLTPLLEKLKAIGEVGKLSDKPKDGAYFDTRDRLLDRAHLIFRNRKGLVTIKSRSENIEDLVDLDTCGKPKYELDYFGDVGYTVSAEIRFEKEEWALDPVKASLGQTMDFLRKKCPSLYKQSEMMMKPLGSLSAPGVAKMWSAEFKPTHPLAGGLKESGISAWAFPPTDQTLVEVAWTGYQKDRAELDMLYYAVKEKLEKADLLAADQSSKTERYFQAYFGATALDARYGFLAQPAYIKHFEADPKDRVLTSPYQQVASREYPAFLDPAMQIYDWVIDADGHVAVVPETMHPYGRVYENGFMRPEDKSQKKPGTAEHYGHVAALAGRAGRISGEILVDKKSGAWIINNKSGRYSKNNPDRTPDQLVAAAKLIQETVNPGGAPWGPVRYMLEYCPDAVRADLQKSPVLQYEDAAKKTKPYVVLVASKAPPAEKGDKADKGEKKDKSEKSDKSEKTEKSDKK